MELKVIIYIVVGVGYFIYNIYKKVNAPGPDQQIGESQDRNEKFEKVQGPPDTRQRGSYKTIDDIINGLHDQGHAKSSPEHSVPSIIREGVDNQEMSLSEIRKEREEEESQKQVVADKSSSSTSSVKSKTFSGKKIKKRKVKFDLRKAVLYRAVLERPKY